MANIRTFVNLQTEVLAWLDEAGDTDVTQTLVKQAIRAAHEKRLTEERWPFMLSSVRTLATVTGKQSYALDADLQKILYVKNLTTQCPLREYQSQNLAQVGYDWSVDTDSATSYALWGHWEVQYQPSSASVVAISSSNSGDNAVAYVTLKGLTATGTVSETVYANASSTAAFTEITKVTKSENWVGTMTMTSNSAAVTNLTLLVGEYGKSYQPLYLFAAPTAAESLEYRFYRQPSALVANGDRPDYPSPFEELLVWEALCDLSMYNSYSTAMVAYWVSKRDSLLLTMRQNAMAQSYDQAPVYTTYIPR